MYGGYACIALAALPKAPEMKYPLYSPHFICSERIRGTSHYQPQLGTDVGDSSILPGVINATLQSLAHIVCSLIGAAESSTVMKVAGAGIKTNGGRHGGDGL